mgnify:CR=1 FL=1
MLYIHKLTKKYGSFTAVRQLSLHIPEGDLFGFVGPNGAGKTTTLHTITGLKKASSGSVELEGHNLLTTEPSKIVGLGMAHVPEGRRIFASMTVEENLEMGAFTIRDKSQILADIENVYKHFPRLRERYKQAGGTLSGGEQQMLAIGRAMMSRPKIMLMDEPSMGLSPLLVGEIFEIIQELNRSGMTILLVEQNAKMALSIADRAYVLETGHVVMNGQAKDMLEDDQVRRAYLGM